MSYLDALNTKLSVLRGDTVASASTRTWLGRPINRKKTTKNRVRFMFEGP